MTDTDITPDDLLNAYKCGLFPMADSADSKEIYWYDPPLRGQLSIKNLHVPKRLKKTILRAPYKVTIDRAFEQVIEKCAESAPDRPSTWINEGICDLFTALYKCGHAHSVECWQGDDLVGGVYGLSIGGVFCGESMFSRARDASKIALVHLCARLWKAGYSVLDTQFINDHLLQFGAYEISREGYLKNLRRALSQDTDFALKHNDLKENDLIHAYFEINEK